MGWAISSANFLSRLPTISFARRSTQLHWILSEQQHTTSRTVRISSPGKREVLGTRPHRPRGYPVGVSFSGVQWLGRGAYHPFPSYSQGWVWVERQLYSPSVPAWQIKKSKRGVKVTDDWKAPLRRNVLITLYQSYILGSTTFFFLQELKCVQKNSIVGYIVHINCCWNILGTGHHYELQWCRHVFRSTTDHMQSEQLQSTNRI